MTRTEAIKTAKTMIQKGSTSTEVAEALRKGGFKSAMTGKPVSQYWVDLYCRGKKTAKKTSKKTPKKAPKITMKTKDLPGTMVTLQIHGPPSGIMNSLQNLLG